MTMPLQTRSYKSHLTSRSGKTRICSRCEKRKKIDQFKPLKGRSPLRSSRCFQCHKELWRVWKTLNPAKDHKKHPELRRPSRRKRLLKKKYNLTVEQYQEMLNDQGGKCAICRTDKFKKALSVDHDHKTGKVRGLLCVPCNTAIGSFYEDVQSMRRGIKYIQNGGVR